jgi:hypothetical protein
LKDEYDFSNAEQGKFKDKANTMETQAIAHMEAIIEGKA